MTRYRVTLRGALVAATALVALVANAAGPRAAGPSVFLVGPAGTPGAQYTSIQAAVNAAQPGDWVLVAPGVYHEKGSNDNTVDGAKSAGVLITKPGLHLRGMDRNRVIVDGTNLPGTPDGTGTQPVSAIGAACPNAEALQDMGPKDSSNRSLGRNGVEAYKASGVWIENMTVCNYLEANGSHAGNEIWWDAGDSSGVATPMTVWGRYLTATSTFYKDGAVTAQYGIFTSNIAPDPTYGPSLIDQTYANNMADSDYYIGACADCNITLNRAWAQNSALGYSGTNGGGRLVISNGKWDHNRSGIVPNTLNNDDAPPPQNGACAPGTTAPAGAPAGICTLIIGNDVHDNNNPNTPGSGIAGAAPVGAGIELAATQNDAVVGNTVRNNGSWGIVAHDYPDTETWPSDLPAAMDCHGGTGTSGGCFFNSQGNRVLNNTLSGNGTNRQATDGDIANEQIPMGNPPNCFSGNTITTEDPPLLQETPCPPGVSDDGGLSAALVCASGLVPSLGIPVTCQGVPQFTYPPHDLTTCSQYAPGSVATGDPTTGACMLPLSAIPPQPSMDACNTAPAPPPNAYCEVLSAQASPSPSALPSTAADATAPRPYLGWIAILALSLLAAPLLWRRTRG